MTEPPASSLPQRTLIFGGTFDPPHRAHVELPQVAARELRCDRIIYIPAALSPLKADPNAVPPTPAHHRLAMLRLALQGVPNTEISTIELDRPPPSYTIDTLRALAGWASPTATGTHAPTHTKTSMVGDAHPAFLLIGADQALDFHRWKDWREILRLATPAVLLRPPWSARTFDDALRERYGPDERVQWMGRALTQLPTMDISATELRDRLRAGRPVNGLIAPAVADYIHTHGLYQSARPSHKPSA